MRVGAVFSYFIVKSCRCHGNVIFFKANDLLNNILDTFFFLLFELVQLVAVTFFLVLFSFSHNFDLHSIAFLDISEA